MKAGRLGKEDLQKLKQIKRRIIKGTHENVKEEVYESFTTAESFLEFINGWENIFDQDDLLIFLLRILSTLEHQNIFIVNNQIYNALFERSFKSIKLHADPKICEICFLIVSKICNNTVRIIQAIKFNFDILLFRYIYTLNLAQYKEGTYALHFLALSFSILIRNNLFDSLLIDWWRFRFFLHNSINCLMDIAFRQNCPFSLSNEQKNLSNSFSISDCDIDNLGISKGSPKNLQLYSIGILLELLVQRPDLLFKMDIGLNWLVPAINQSSNVLGTILINILCKWLDSPNIRKNGELKYIVQQLFCPLISFDSLRDLSAKIVSSHSPTFIETCKNSLLNLLSTWPGLFTFFSTNSKRQFGLFDHIASQTLNLNSDEIKSYTIELLCDSLNVPYARHEFSGLFNQWENAFFFYKQIRLPDLFSIFLRDDFLFAEIAYLDNQKDDSFIDLLEIYRSVVLFEIVSEKLPEALIRLILPNPDYPISIKATFLLADILYMSRLLPKSIRFEALSINNLIHSIVESSYLNENISNKEEKKWNGFLLIDRLNEVNNFLNKSTALKSLTLINTFLIVNEEEFRKGRRSTSILRNNRHSSSSVTNNIEECNDNANDVFETFSEEFSSDHFDSNIDILISKAFNKTTKTYKNVTENFQQKLKKNDSLEDLNEYLIENTDWNIIWRILAFVDDKIISFQNKSTIDKCIPIFNRIINLFLPSNQFFTQNKPSTQLIKCGQYCIQLLCELNSSTFVGADNVQWAEDMLLKFTYDFCDQINIDDSEAVFSSKNLSFGGSSVYFAMLRALSSHPFGQKLIEQTGLGQIFLDKLLEESTSPELIKLTVVSFDYFTSFPKLDNGNGCFARFLLENVLNYSKNIAIRKWCTKFVGSFFTLNRHYSSFQINFSWEWPLNLLFHQLSDPSPKIVNVTMRILLKWLSLCPIDIRVEMREQLKRSKLETLGDSGTLLEVFLFDADLDAIEDDKAKLLLEIASNSLNKWNDYFYIHYNEIIAEQIRRALLDNNGGRNGFFCFRRSKNGDFARASGQLPISVPNHKKEKVFPPPHLYGHLARSKRGQKLLQNFNIFGKLEQIICNFLQNGILSDFQMGEVKGSLFALAQILSNLPSSVNFPIIKYTQLLLECVLQKNNNSINFPWLSIRGCAIWAINIAAKTENQLVIQTLFEAGWEFGEFFDNFELKNQKNKIKNFISSNKLQKRKIILKRKRTKSEYIEEENLKNVLYRSSSLDSFFIILNSTSSIKAIDYSFFEKEFYNKFYERANIKELSINNLNKKETLKITEKENNDLIVYRKFLAKIDDLDSQNKYYKQINNFNKYIFNNFGYIILPKNISIFGNIFNENKNKKSSFYSLEKKYLNKKHCKFLCIFCSIPKQLNIEKEIVKEKEKEKIEDEIRQLIYQFATQFSNTEIALKLLRIYKVQPEAFDNRCLFSDAINFLSDSRTISFGGRRLLYQLFWKALSN